MNKNINILDVIQAGRLNKHRIELGVAVKCPVCQTVLTNSNAQYAHYMSQGKQSRAKHGDKYIDHKYNGAYVCGLQCNNDIQIDRQPNVIQCLKADIDEELLTHKYY